ncbi:MAG: dihydropteroate synthase [Spirochaetota bacterium]
MTSVLPLPRGRSVSLEPFALMGVVNVTPDSFYAGSRHQALGEALEIALRMVDAGALIIDIGGESTRPGSLFVDEESEFERVIPLVRAIRAQSDVAISVDTRKAGVWRGALDSGADILNDISALRNEAECGSLAARAGAPVVLMHMQGEPTTMQEAPVYGDCVSEVVAFLGQALRRALDSGIAADRIVLDPGIGFGKRLEDNLALIAGLGAITALGCPVLVGLSRKSFLGALTGRPAEGRLAGSLGATAAAWQAGARVFRVHDVEETRDLLTVVSAVASAAVAGSAAAARSGTRG